MAFDPKEYEELQKKLNEMKSDESFKKYAETKKKERSKFTEIATSLMAELKKKKFSNSDIAGIAGKLRWEAIKADKPESKE